MTDEEKAEDVLIRLQRQSVMGKQKGIIRRAIEEAKKAGAEEEREACAQFLAKHACIYLTSRDLQSFPSEDWSRHDAIAHMLEEMGKAIRARSDS